MNKLVIIRGPSGSGKSTIANCVKREFLLAQSLTQVPHFEVDMFFTNKIGEYKFVPTLVDEAHLWCRLSVEKALAASSPLVIVSNTSTRLREVRAYLNLANRYNYESEVIRTPKPWDAEVLAARNIHRIPIKSIEKQIARYVEIDGEIEWSL